MTFNDIVTNSKDTKITAVCAINFLTKHIAPLPLIQLLKNLHSAKLAAADKQYGCGKPFVLKVSVPVNFSKSVGWLVQSCDKWFKEYC